MIAFDQTFGHPVERAAEQTKFVLLFDVDAVLIIAGGYLSRSFGQLQYRPRNAASNPNPKDGGKGEAKQCQSQVGSLQFHIWSEFFIEGTLQKCGRVSVLGR